jgi:translocator protein
MSILAMILFPLCVTLPGMINGILTANNIKTWYEKLNHPKIRPPNWVFGPVWTILYIMIGVSGYLIWSLDEGFSGKYSFAWTIYFIQLLLNHIWTPLFFGIHALFLALIDIVLMLIAIYINIFAFYAIYPLAGLLLIPYACWVSFATYLNFSYWYLNRLNTVDYDKKLVS